MVPYLTRVMTQAEYVVVTDLYSLIPFALVLLTMGLESGWFRFAGKAADEAEKRTIFASTWGTTLIAAVVFMGLVLLFNNHIAAWTGYAEQPSYIWLTGIIVALDVATAMPFARLREQRRRMRYVVVRLASVVVNLALCLIFFSTSAGLWIPDFGAGWVLAANVAGSAVSLVMLMPSVRGIVPRLDRRVLNRIMVYSFPLLVSGIAGTAGEFIDRQMIKWLMPPEVAMSSLGVYGAATKLAVIMILFTQMYRLAAEPFFLSKFGKGEFARQSALAMKLYIAAAVVIFAVIMVAKPLVVLILGEGFREGSNLLPILLAANALAGVVLNLSFWYKQAERTWMAIAVTGAGLAVAVTLNIILIPHLGYEGAAWARLACEASMVVVSLILVSRIRKLS
jgi:O-antigen/teichoic acid export membrane protein